VPGIHSNKKTWMAGTSPAHDGFRGISLPLGDFGSMRRFLASVVGAGIDRLELAEPTATSRFAGMPCSIR
jgi:hypothetical protein